MAAAADERLDSLFEQLNECATSQQHKKAIRIADESELELCCKEARSERPALRSWVHTLAYGLTCGPCLCPCV